MSSGLPKPQIQPYPSDFDLKYRKPRTLVLCFDGTNDVFDDTSTNLLRLFEALEKNTPAEQLVYYQPGIGTYVRAEAPWAPWIRDVSKSVDKGFAWYIGTHITGGYKFLMQHYTKGDRVCLFGFSRGAYTARCLAGMLHKVGLLPRSNMEQVEFAYSLYENTDPANTPRARKFKQTFSSDVTVDFVGVWDTVSSVGWGAPFLPFNQSETFVRTFRHALALDERRVKFQPNAWQYKRKCAECGSAARTQGSPLTNIRELTKSRTERWTVDSQCWCQDERQYHGGQLTDVLEVWFPGFHADVGGGNELNTFRVSLANPSLRWMVTEILKDTCKIIFKRDAFLDWLPSLNAKIHAFNAVSINAPKLPSHFLDPDEDGDQDLHPVMETEPGLIAPLGTEGNPAFLGKKVKVLDEPVPDDEAVARMNDMICKKPWWWILEFVPIYQYWLDKDKTTTVHRYALNYGIRRKIDHRIPLLHRCVEERQVRDHSYTPEDRCTFKEQIVYVHEDDDLPVEMKDKIKVAEKAMKILPLPAPSEKPKSPWKKRIFIGLCLLIPVIWLAPRFGFEFPSRIVGSLLLG